MAVAVLLRIPLEEPEEMVVVVVVLATTAGQVVTDRVALVPIDGVLSVVEMA